MNIKVYMLLYLYCIQGIIRHRFNFAPFALLSAGEIRTGQIPVSQIISF